MPDDDGFSIESHCIAKSIIESFFLQDVLVSIDECDTATDVANSVNIRVVAIRWVVRHRLQLKKTTICKSFVKLVYWTLL